MQEKTAQIKAHFAADLSRCLSVERLAEYDGSAAAHGANLALAGDVLALGGLLEIALRNYAYAAVCELTKDPDWLRKFDDEIIQQSIAKLKQRYGTESPSNAQIVSNLTLGSWVFIIEHFRLAGGLFGGIELGKYSLNNQRNRMRKCTKIQRSRGCLRLFHHLRNRAAHYENLGKITDGYSRVSVKIDGFKMDVHPSMLLVFVADLVQSMNARLLSSLPERLQAQIAANREEFGEQFMSGGEVEGGEE